MTATAWIDGELMDAESASVPLLSHALHYGTAVFEGIRVYDTAAGPAFFRLDDHLDRLFASASMYSLRIPYARAQVRRAAFDLVRASGFRECYVRPLAFAAEGTMSVSPRQARVSLAIAVWEWGSYLGEAGRRHGIRAKVSSWRTLSDSAAIPPAKASGHYLNSALARLEVERSGYDEAILLDEYGMVAEGSGENIFLVVEGGLVTPSAAAPILDGITRRSVIEIAGDAGIPLAEREVARDELYLAEEIFLTGTAAELTPVREIDDRRVGGSCPGQITEALQGFLEDALRGRHDRYRGWSEPVGGGAPLGHAY